MEVCAAEEAVFFAVVLEEVVFFAVEVVFFAVVAAFFAVVVVFFVVDLAGYLFIEKQYNVRLLYALLGTGLAGYAAEIFYFIWLRIKKMLGQKTPDVIVKDEPTVSASEGAAVSNENANVSAAETTIDNEKSKFPNCNRIKICYTVAHESWRTIGSDYR